MFESAQRLARLHDRVARSALFALLHKTNTGGLQRRTHQFGFMSNDGEDIFWRHNLAGRCYHMRQQCLAGNLDAAPWDAATSAACLCPRQEWQWQIPRMRSGRRCRTDFGLFISFRVSRDGQDPARSGGHLSLIRFHHQPQQVMRHVVGFVAGDQALGGSISSAR